MSEPSPPASAPLVERAVQLARHWASEAAGAQGEKPRARLVDMLNDRDARRFAIDVADSVIRPESAAAAVAQLRRFAPGAPAMLPWYVRGTVQVGAGIAPVLPAPVVPIARRMLRDTLRPLVIDARPARIGGEIERLSAPGIRLDLALIGERVLGEAAAKRRRDGIHDLIRRDDVDRVSLDVRSIVAPASDWAFDDLVAHAADALAPLFATAATTGCVVALDVTSYGDLDLTVAVFTRLLEERDLAGVTAAITLPTALPDAFSALQELTAWAQDRVAHGAAPVVIGLSNGSNLAGERADAVLHGWTQAGFDTALDADANRLRCLDWALRPEHAHAVRISVSGDDLGIAAYAWLLAQERGLDNAVEIEFAHDGGSGLSQAVARDTGTALVRVAAVMPAEFDIAIGQVLREIDAAAGDGSVERLADALRRSAAPDLRSASRRTQNRMAPVHESVRQVVQAPQADENLTRAVLGITRGSDDEAYFETAVYSERELAADAGGAPGFENAADSDPSTPANRDWAREVFERIADGDDDAARPDLRDASALVEDMRRAGASWGSRPASDRSEILLRAAAVLEGRRGELIVIAASETGELLAEGDAEVTRAVDLARYYAATARELDAITGAAFVPVPVTVVDSTGAEPIAAPADGVFAALAAGSAVVLSSRAPRTAAAIAESLWQAGVPRDALALAAAPAEVTAKEAATATSAGCGSVIVTASADVDQAVADIVRSAFWRAGQAESAVSLVILVGAAGRSKRFARQLADAVRALHVGVPGDPRAQVGPLIEKPDDAATRTLTELDDDEEWLVRPRLVGADETGRMWSPGVRVGVRPDSRFLLDGGRVPVLGIMHAPTLESAIDLQNAVGPSPVAGLHTGDAGELELWLDLVDAATLIVNRATVDLKAQRQPIAGSGGPNRLIGLGSWRAQRSAALSSTLHLRGLDSRITALIEAAQPSLDYEAFEALRRAALSDALAWDRGFGQVRDASKLGVERDLLRYRPVPVEMRVASGAPLADVLRVVIAAVRAGSDFVLSLAEGLPAAVRHALAEQQAVVRLESDEEWIARGERGRVRLVGGADAVAVLRARLSESPHATGAVFDGEVTSAGRIELLTFVREQSISITAHRAGTIDDWSSAVI